MCGFKLNYMLNKIIFVFVFSFFQIYAQNNIEVIYKTSFNGSFLTGDNKNNEHLKALNEGLEEKIGTLGFQLIINNQKSLFKSIPEMEKDGETTGQKMAKIVVGYDVRYYTDLNKKKIIQELQITDKKSKVDLGFNTFNWTYENNEKIINGYKCYLAKTKYGTLDVYAWYCPALPYSFGPTEFCNLPGLILELQKGNVIYLASKILFSSTKSINFEISEFETISKETRDEISNKQREYIRSTLIKE